MQRKYVMNGDQGYFNPNVFYELGIAIEKDLKMTVYWYEKEVNLGDLIP